MVVCSIVVPTVHWDRFVHTWSLASQVVSTYSNIILLKQIRTFDGHRLYRSGWRDWIFRQCSGDRCWLKLSQFPVLPTVMLRYKSHTFDPPMLLGWTTTDQPRPLLHAITKLPPVMRENNLFVWFLEFYIADDDSVSVHWICDRDGFIIGDDWPLSAMASSSGSLHDHSASNPFHRLQDFTMSLETNVQEKVIIMTVEEQSFHIPAPFLQRPDFPKLMTEGVPQCHFFMYGAGPHRPDIQCEFCDSVYSS
jgi:hypothetical protein